MMLVTFLYSEWNKILFAGCNSWEYTNYDGGKQSRSSPGCYRTRTKMCVCKLWRKAGYGKLKSLPLWYKMVLRTLSWKLCDKLVNKSNFPVIFSNLVIRIHGYFSWKLILMVFAGLNDISVDHLAELHYWLR